MASGSRIALRLGLLPLVVGLVRPNNVQLSTNTQTARAGQRQIVATSETADDVSNGARWIVTLDIGREKGTSMPAAWAASGARLPFSVEVDVLTSSVVGAEGKVGRDAKAFKPRAPVISVTGFSGAVTAPVRGGGWRVDEDQLAFWLDFPEASTRGDVAGDVANVWGLAPGVASQGMDVDLPAGRLVCMSQIYADGELERLNKAYVNARSVAFKARQAVTLMEQAKNPTPKWSVDKAAWVSESVNEGFVAESLKRKDAALAEQQLARADDRRPKRKELSRDAGPWPGVGDASWVAKKGTILHKRSGRFGLAQYSVLGTGSAEPMDPVETFWTMPE